jgi:FliW protein
MTTVNLKAPLFVNMRNRRGVQIIIDDARFSTRHPLWSEDSAEEGKAENKDATPADDKDQAAKK